MYKEKICIYNRVLAVVIEEFGISEQPLFYSNESDCVQARTALVVGLTRRGFSDKDIAELTGKMRRCSVCAIRNRYKDDTAEWSVRRCIEAINNELKRT